MIRRMEAAIVAVGSELLGTERLDTNSLKLTRALERHGVELRAKSVIGDREEEIAGAMRGFLDRYGLVLVTGGLGPTADDVTREAAAAALGRGVHLDAEVLVAIEQRFHEHGLRMAEINRRQALIVDGAEVIANPRGTAPGQLLTDDGGATLFLFPGVPSELAGMIAESLEPWLAARSGGVGRETVTLKIACMPESAVEERISPAYAELGRENVTILASPSDIRLCATASGSEEERRRTLAAMSSRLAELAGDAVYALCEEDTLESVVGGLLRDAGQTLATAESCTGGLVAERITRVPGSSDYFVGREVTYTYELKTRRLGVPA
jgi:nicotinamide-nucleotide amidase